MFRTFDGKHFTFSGDCSYLLTSDSQSNFKVYANYEKSNGETTSVRKSITVVSEGVSMRYICYINWNLFRVILYWTYHTLTELIMQTILNTPSTLSGWNRNHQTRKGLRIRRICWITLHCWRFVFETYRKQCLHWKWVRSNFN